MKLQVNKATDYYAQASAMFVDIFMNTMPPASKDSGRFTAPHRAGIIIPLKGSAIFSLNGTPYRMNAKTIVHAGPSMNIEIEVLGEEAWEYAVVHYKLLKDETDKFPLFFKHFSITIEDNKELADFAHQLMMNYMTPTNLAKVTCKSLFLRIIETLLQSASKNSMDPGENLMEAVVRYFHENYAKPIMIQELAEELGVERRRFAYLFERYTGSSPNRYLTEIRMRRAKELLRIGYSVSEVAEKLGYIDYFYFSRVFKSHTGMSPTQFKKHL